jgi:hypothetical protein
VSDEKTLSTGVPAGRVVGAGDRYIHSEIFDRLVHGPNDIPGLVAYGIYQTRKRTYINDCKKRMAEFRPKKNSRHIPFRSAMMHFSPCAAKQIPICFVLPTL